MITRFYVDNYKCLTNFEYKPKAFELVLGANGTGKTTVFEALDRVRRFVVGGESARTLFPSSCFTRWSSRRTQVFEVDFLEGGSKYQYRLEIGLMFHHCVEKETLIRDGVLLSESGWEEPDAGAEQVTQFSDDEDIDPFDERTQRVLLRHYQNKVVKNPLADPHRFGLGYITPLKAALSNFYLIKINPPCIKSQVGKAQTRPANDLSNFASYYFYLLQKKQGKVFELLPHLRQVISGFDQFTIEEDYEEGRRDLEIAQRRKHLKHDLREPFSLRLEELSDGQRALIALYTLLHCTLEPNSTLVIDEPENYVALSELQPWLAEMRERVEERGGQVILISHHPEFINALAPESATLFKRDEGGPVRIAPFRTEGFEGLTPAEIVARGWES